MEEKSCRVVRWSKVSVCASNKFKSADKKLEADKKIRKKEKHRAALHCHTD